MTVVLLVYAGARGYLLTEPTIGVGQRGTGFGAGALTPEEQVARFGANPLPFYAYNVAAASSSVLFSQPTIGQFTAINAWRNGSASAGVHAADRLVAADVAADRLVRAREGRAGRRRWREPVPLAFITAARGQRGDVGYSYAKDEIISTAGVFYALTAFLAIRALLARRPPLWLAPALIVLALTVSAAWAMRSVGLHLKLRHGAFEARSEWTYVLNPSTRATWPTDPRTLRSSPACGMRR